MSAFDDLPEIIRIGNFDYKIMKWSTLESSSSRRFAEFCPLTRTIKIREDIIDKQIVHSLIHEIFHGIFDHYDIDDSDKEEKIVTLLSNGFHSLIINNPWLLTWIIKYTS